MGLYEGVDPLAYGNRDGAGTVSGGRDSSTYDWGGYTPQVYTPGDDLYSMPEYAKELKSKQILSGPQSYDELINSTLNQDTGKSPWEDYFSGMFSGKDPGVIDENKRQAFSQYKDLAGMAQNIYGSIPENMRTFAQNPIDPTTGIFTPYAWTQGQSTSSPLLGQYMLSNAPDVNLGYGIGNIQSSAPYKSTLLRDPLTGAVKSSFNLQEHGYNPTQGAQNFDVLKAYNDWLMKNNLKAYDLSGYGPVNTQFAL